MAAAAAVAAAAGSTVAAGLASAADVRPRGVALAAATGGLTVGLCGVLLWRGIYGKKAPIERAISLVDKVHAKQPRRPDDALDEVAYCLEVERFVLQLRGGAVCVPPALRLAARAQHFERRAIDRKEFPDGREGYLKWRSAVKRRQGRQLLGLLRSAGIEEDVASRAAQLVGKDLPLAEDADMQTLEDAACLVFLEHELDQFQRGKDDAKLVEVYRKTWKKMSVQARVVAVGLDFAPRMLGCIVEAIAAAEGLEAAKPPLVAPRLPAATVKLLRSSWSRVPQDQFGNEFFERLYDEDQELRPVFSFVVARKENIPKAIHMLLDLLDAEQVPRFERVVHAVMALSRDFGKLKMAHMAPIKRALIRTVTAHAPLGEKKLTNLAWEAFFFSLAAVAAPDLMLAENMSDFSEATAALLPTPGGGPHSGAIGAHGVALLEMSLGITALSRGGSSAPEEVVGKLREARGWLIDAVRDDVNAYCGLLSSVYSRPSPEEEEPAPEGARGVSAEEAERRRWWRRAIEVPLRVAEVSMGAAVTCLPCRKQIKRSLQGDWIAGAKLLRTATEISMKNVSLNLRDLRTSVRNVDFDTRLGRLRDMEPPWEDLCDV